MKVVLAIFSVVLGYEGLLLIVAAIAPRVVAGTIPPFPAFWGIVIVMTAYWLFPKDLLRNGG